MKFNLFSLAALQYSAFAINFGVQFILTFLLPTTVFGEYAKIQTTVDVILIFFSVGFHATIFQPLPYKTEEIIRHTFWLSLLQTVLVTIIGAVVLLVLYLLDFYSLKNAILTEILLITSSLANTKQVFYAGYEVQKKFIFNSKIAFIINSIVAITTIFIAFYSPSVELLAGKTIFMNILLIGTYLYLAVYMLKLNLSCYNFDKILLKIILNFSLRLYVARMLEALQTKIDILLVSYLFSYQESGLYERVRYYASVVPTLFGNLISRLAAVAYRAKANLNQLYYVHSIIILAVPILYLFAFFAFYSIGFIFKVQIFKELYPLYFCFWHFAGTALFLDNIKTYLQIRDSVLQTTLKLRFIPLLVFIGLLAIFWLLNFAFNTQLVAFLFAFSLLAAFLFISPTFFFFPLWRFSKYIAKKVKHFIAISFNF